MRLLAGFDPAFLLAATQTPGGGDRTEAGVRKALVALEFAIATSLMIATAVLVAVRAVAIGCIGLYGLAAFETARRVEDLSIRKTLGASTTDMLRLVIGQRLRPVLVAASSTDRENAFYVRPRQ